VVGCRGCQWRDGWRAVGGWLVAEDISGGMGGELHEGGWLRWTSVVGHGGAAPSLTFGVWTRSGRGRHWWRWGLMESCAVSAGGGLVVMSWWSCCSPSLQRIWTGLSVTRRRAKAFAQHFCRCGQWRHPRGSITSMEAL
jgi:hypothetical protein